MTKMRIQTLVGAKPTLFHNIISKKNGTQIIEEYNEVVGGVTMWNAIRKHLLRKHHRQSHSTEREKSAHTHISLANRKIVNDWWKRTENLLQIKDIRIHLCVVIPCYAFVFFFFSASTSLEVLIRTQFNVTRIVECILMAISIQLDG